VFAARDQRRGSRYVVDVAFTDRRGGVSTGPYATLDLTRDRPGATEELRTNRALLAESFGVSGFALMRQVHGGHVETVTEVPEQAPRCDGLVTSTPEVALCVRVGDCVPLVLADVDAGAVAVAHVGRPGVTAGIVAATVQAVRDAGAQTLEAWVGPHVCAGCYEVPTEMRDAVAQVEPTAFSCTTWGTPSVDIGASVVAQLARLGCRDVNEVALCTQESDDLFSYRRQGPSSGRLAGLVVLRDLNGSDSSETAP
jgi:purine-nucleoside/S-methyl-5'-thioadenosine phosphorylase / adenosine deaminase